MATPEKITISNYEAFVVDYWDGNLSPEQQALLMLFLDQHPEIKKDVFDAGEFTLLQEDIAFEEKDLLYKSEIDAAHIDEYLVGELEQQLLPQEQAELNQFVKAHPQFERDRALYALTKIKPDKNLVYPDKRSLKKGVIQPLWIRYSSVAAAACLFLVFGLWFTNRDNTIALSSKPGVLALPTLELGGMTASQQIITAAVAPSIAPVGAILNGVSEIESSVPKVKATVNQVQTRDAVAEDFYSYSKNRSADDYLSGLVNSYLPETRGYIASGPIENEEGNTNNPTLRSNANTLVNGVAAKGLTKIIKDTLLTNELKNDKYSIKTKVATTIAWATRKASGGKVKAVVIPNYDGTLSAMSFTNGKYNYTKRF